MPPHFRIRTLMIAVVAAALVAWCTPYFLMLDMWDRLLAILSAAFGVPLVLCLGLTVTNQGRSRNRGTDSTAADAPEPPTLYPAGSTAPDDCP
jgi:hypothetical protein